VTRNLVFVSSGFQDHLSFVTPRKTPEGSNANVFTSEVTQLDASSMWEPSGEGNSATIIVQNSTTEYYCTLFRTCAQRTAIWLMILIFPVIKPTKYLNLRTYNSGLIYINKILSYYCRYLCRMNPCVITPCS
jgi:hypothetical protein